MSTTASTQAVATVISVTGLAFARNADGAVRRLAAGDTLLQGETVFTLANGQIELAFSDGHTATILGSESYLLGPETLIATSPDAGEAAIAAAGEVGKVIAALEQGGDILEGLEAPAAGPGGAGAENSGNGFVRLLRIAEGVTPISFEYPVNTVEEIKAPEGNVVPVEEEPPVISVSVSVDVSVDIGEGGPGQDTTTIIYDPSIIPVVSASAVSILEGTGDTPYPVTFIISLDRTYSHDVTVSYVITGGTASQGVDYLDGTFSGTVTIPAGAYGFTVTVFINPDYEIESNEDFQIVLTSAVGATINPDADTATVTIIDDDTAPVAVDDENSGTEDIVSISSSVPGLLTNDSDADGNPIVVTAVRTGAEADTGTAGTLGTTLQGQYGTLQLNADGSYTYTLTENLQYLDDGEQVQDFFTYTISDPGGNTDQATLTITITGADDGMVVVDDTDSFSAAAVQSTVAGTTNVLSNDSDPDTTDNPLAVNDTTVQNVYLVNSDGTLSTTVAGTITIAADGTYSLSLNDTYKAAAIALDEGESFRVGVTYTAINQDSATADGVLRITVAGANEAPTISITGGTHSVYEAGLPLGSGVGPTTKVVTGTFTLADTDGLDDLVSIKVNGTTFTIAQLSAATVGSPLLVGDTTAGALYITNYDSGTGVVSYKYVLDTAITDAPAVTEQDTFNVSVSDDGTTFSAPATITVTIVDDLPLFTIINDGTDSGSVVSISTSNPASTTTYNGQFADWKYGADGAQGVPTLSGITGNASINTALSTSTSVVIDLKDASGNIIGRLTLNADGTDSLQVFHRDPTLLTDVLLTSDVTASGPSLTKTINSSISGLVITITGDDGNATPNENSDKVNPSNQGWAVGANIIEGGESIKFSFNQSVNRFSFVADGFTGNPSNGDVGLIVRVYYTATIYEDFYVNAMDGQVIQVADLAGFGMTVGTTTYTSFVAVNVLSNPAEQGSGDGFRLNNVTVAKLSSEAPPDFDYNFTLNVVDGDGDPVTQSFSVHLDGDASGGLVLEAIAGTSGADVLTGTGGNDVIIGGGGNDTLTGGLGSDTFVWHLADKGTTTTPAVDTIMDFSRTQGDTLNLSDLLVGENSGNLTSYLSFTEVDGNAVLNISSSGSGAVDQQIVFDNYSLAQLQTEFGATDAIDLVGKMKLSGSLITD